MLGALVIDDPNDEAIKATYFTSCGTLSTQTAASTVEALMNQAYLHQLSPSIAILRIDPNDVVESLITSTISRYDSSQFYSIIIDTGAAKRSIAGSS